MPFSTSTHIPSYTLSLLVNESMRIGAVAGSMGAFNIATNEASCRMGSLEYPGCPFSSTLVRGGVLCEDDTLAPIIRCATDLTISVSGDEVEISCLPNLWEGITNLTEVSLHAMCRLFTW